MTLGTAYGPPLNPILSRTAYGEIHAESLNPVVQITGVYGILNKVDSFEVLGGSTTAENSVFKVDSGTNPNGFAAVLSKRQITYRAGLGVMGRWTAIFDTPQTDSAQESGLSTNTDRLGFGFQGETFGVIYSFNGESEIQELTITTPASGSETAIITVDGDDFSVPLTAGTVQQNAVEIATSLEAQVADYNFTANNDQVVARSFFPVPAASFAFTSATAVAAWVQVQIGVNTTDGFVPQSQWNTNTRPDLDVEKGNVYQVQFQFLGFGVIYFSIEEPTTGLLEVVHVIRYTNENTVPNLGNPTFRIGWVAQNFGNTTPISLSGSSAAMFNEGNLKITEQPRSVFKTTSVDTTVFKNIITLRSRLVMGTKRNRVETLPLFLFALTDSTKGALIEITAESAFSSELNFQYIDKDTSTSEVATDTVDVTGGRLIASIPVSTLGARLDLAELGTFLLPGEAITISAKIIAGSAGSVSVTLNFVEDL